MRLEVHPDADAEFVAAVERITRERGEERANKVYTGAQRAFEALRDGKEVSGPAVHVAPELNARRVLVRGTRYQVVFVERAEFRAVVAVAHSRRKPGYWRPRLKDYPTP
jgi:plasmid stabilization system protein ParE